MLREDIMKKPDKELIKEITDLKKKRNAVIIAHYYQRPEVQDAADLLGDSLALSRAAAETNAEVIVFCGVNFMAETASILSPDKKVIIPVRDAGCPLADTIDVKGLREMKKKHPAALVVCYVNTAAEIKAESDICCTSSNSIKVVNSLPPDKEIIFVPDKNLCDYTSSVTGRRLICWQGDCATHANIKADEIKEALKLHPSAKVMVHPECTAEVIGMADCVGSTAGMLRYAGESSAGEFIVGTEVGIIHQLKIENPFKVFYPTLEPALCPTMKLITLEKVLWSLENLSHEVKVAEDIRIKAKRSIDGMLAIG